MRLLLHFSILTAVLACPHDGLNFRTSDGNVTAYADPGGDWTYDNSFNWGLIKADYWQCGVGVTQSPIDLSGPFSAVYTPTFNYSSPVSGEISNWGYGVSFKLDNMNGRDVTGNPTLKFDDEELYLRGFHTHAPSEHTIDGVPTRIEAHLVHVDSKGVPQGVVGILIDVNATANNKLESPFLSRLIHAPRPGSKVHIPIEDFDISGLLKEVGDFKDYWTYRGSLTTPPCSGGVRWWVSGEVLLGSDFQVAYMRWVSKFSARPVQPIWRQAVGTSVEPGPVQPTWVPGMEQVDQKILSTDVMDPTGFAGQLEL